MSSSDSPQSAYSLENLFLEMVSGDTSQFVNETEGVTQEIPPPPPLPPTKTTLGSSGSKKEATESSTFLCSICYENYTNSMLALDCSCSSRICKNCIKGHIEARLNYHFQTVTINCPGCPAVIPDEKIEEFCSADVLAKLNRFRIVAQARKDPKSIVYCPQVNCGCPTTKEEGQTSITCKKCSFSYCPDCLEAVHPDLSCKEAFKKLPKAERQRKQTIKRRAMMAGALSHVWATWKTKQCPACKSFIEKNGGCHHMHCHYCNHNFCWNCGGDYNKRHCITRKVLLTAAMPVTIPTAIALAPVTGVVSLGLMAGDKLVGKKTGYRNGKYVDATVVQAWRFGYNHFGKYFVEPFFD